MNTPHFAVPPPFHPSFPTTYPTFPIHPMHDPVHAPTLPSPFPDLATSSNQQYFAPPTSIYIKEDNALKLPTCPEDAKDFPTYKMKVRASLCKFNMHHLLDDHITTNEANKDISAKLASALLLSFKNKHIKWFMGSDSKQYKERGIKMWQHLRYKFLDQVNEDEIYNRLLCPKMSPDESPLDYKITIDQAIHAAHAKNLPVSLRQVIKAAGHGLNPNRYKAIMDSYAVENKTFDSLDMMVDILEQYDKNTHVKASRKAQSTVKSPTNNTKSSPNTTTNSATPSSVPTPTPHETKTLEDVCKLNKKRTCIICGGKHYVNNCEILKSLGYTCSFTRPNANTSPK